MLLDDELPGLAYLKMLCSELEELEVVKAFNNPEVFLRESAQLEFDLCILDIEMPGMNGLQVASLLKGKSVIFTSAYREYAAEAFDINAIDYVRKPVERNRLRQAVQKVLSHVQQQPVSKEFVQLNTDKGKSLVFFDHIVYCTVSETDSRDKLLHLSDGTLLTLKNISFDRLMNVLPQGQFCRINKRDVVALKSVQSFSYDEITTNTATPSGEPVKLTLSESYRKDFLRKVHP